MYKRSKRVLQNQKGFSLVEGLLAIAVFGLFVSGTTSAFVYGQQSAFTAGQRERAAAVLDSTLESVRSIAVEEWRTIQDAGAGPYGLVLASDRWTLSGSSSTQDIFTQEIAFEDICRNSTTGEIESCTGTNRDVHSKRMTVTVTWSSLFNMQRSISRTTQLTNWGTNVWTQTDWSNGSGQAIWSDEAQYDSDADSPDISTVGQVSASGTAIGCGVKTYDFDTASDYTYNFTDVEISGGVAQLVGSGVPIDENAMAVYHADDTAAPYQDATNNNNDLLVSGNTINYAYSEGKWGQAFKNDDANNDFWYIKDANQTGLDLQSAFTLEGWYKPVWTTTGNEMLFQKQNGIAQFQYKLYWQIVNTTHSRIFFQIGNGSAVTTLTTNTFPYDKDTYYHLAAVFDGTSGMKVFLDGVEIASSNEFSGTIPDGTGDFRIGGQTAEAFGGAFDEVRISNVARYTSNFTPHSQPYGTLVYSDQEPTVQPVAAYTPDNIDVWYGFEETATKPEGTEIYYQLSDDGGETWQYWNGSAWAVAGETDYTTAAVINENIQTFDISENQLLWRAFLSSDGEEQVQLDSVTLTCARTVNDNFTTVSNYTYPSSIELADGQAQLAEKSAGYSAIDTFPVDEYEYDPHNGTWPDATILNGSDTVVAVVSQMWGDQGWLKTIAVDSDTGTFTEPWIASARFDMNNGRGYDPAITHVRDDLYAIVYRDRDEVMHLNIADIHSDGTIQNITVAAEVVDASESYNPNVLKVSEDTIAVIYNNGGGGGRVKTYTVDASGAVTAVDSMSFASQPGWVHVTEVSSNIYAIAYRDNVDGSGDLVTIRIEDDGSIQDTVIDALTYDTGNTTGQNRIAPLGNDIYAIVYSGVDSDGFLATVDIDSAGNIGSVLDMLEFDTANATYPGLIDAGSNGVLVWYEQQTTSGRDYLHLYEVNSSGEVTPTPLSSLYLGINKRFAPVFFQLSTTIWMVVSTGDGADGHVYTFSMTPSGGGGYSTDVPSIQVNVNRQPSDVSGWLGFEETATKPEGTEIYYQLSDDGGETWQYWNGSAWAVAGETDYTTAAVINENIHSFDVTAETMQFKAFLESDGETQVQLDSLMFYYTEPETITGSAGGTATLTSSAFDMGGTANITKIEWEEGSPACDESCTVQIQIRTAPDNTGSPGEWTSWFGDAGADSYFTDSASSVPPSDVQGNQWVQYRVTLDGSDGGSPVLTEIRIFYD